MVFAAGFGTRMGHLTKAQPKPLIKVAGMPLIDRALGLVSEVEPPRTVVNLHYLPDMLETHLDGQSIITVREEPEILETGGGLRNALPLLQSDPVLTLNPDVIWSGPNPLKVALDAWDPDRMDALLVCIPETRVHGREGGGDFHVDEGGRLHRGGNLVYGGVQIMKTARLHNVQQKAFSLNVVWNEMANDGRLHGVEYPGQWTDVGRPEGIDIAEQMLRNHNV
ncbi:nucleotidyltransferase family protein [Tateyamaria omphalii]|nr:nucleotidyltransferase family protein [Tateyamaria omphalii]